MSPWPRRLFNFPLVLMATTQQLIWAVALAVDPSAVYATPVYIHVLYLERGGAVIALVLTAALAVLAFHMKLKAYTLLSLLPQQFLLYISAAASLHAVWVGQFADGVVRSHAFIAADQCLMILLAIAHTWAMILIMLYGEDLKE